jgi:hypothetical protein
LLLWLALIAYILEVDLYSVVLINQWVLANRVRVQTFLRETFETKKSKLKDSDYLFFIKDGLRANLQMRVLLN